jgi:hypothetical protein
MFVEMGWYGWLHVERVDAPISLTPVEPAAGVCVVYGWMDAVTRKSRS